MRSSFEKIFRLDTTTGSEDKIQQNLEGVKGEAVGHWGGGKSGRSRAPSAGYDIHVPRKGSRGDGGTGRFEPQERSGKLLAVFLTGVTALRYL